MHIGFIGLGVMGRPMALNLVRAGMELTVWNRSTANSEVLRAAGARVASGVPEVFERTRIVILMLSGAPAMDAVLGRGTPVFRANVADHVIVHMGTTSPEYSLALGHDIQAAGGRYVEAPVSGSRVPAEAGQLVAMLAGADADVEEIEPLLRAMCRQSVFCGPLPTALLMKLSVNLFLISMVTGLVEATHFAQQHRLDMQRFRAVLDAGPMASVVSRLKLEKLVANDFAVQAAVGDVLNNNRLIAEAARRATIASPLLDVCHALFSETQQLGHGQADMIAVLRAIEGRTASRQGSAIP